MSFVLDASVAASWAFSDESHPAATVAFARAEYESCAVPALWWFEIRNVLLMGERRRRLTISETTAFLSRLSELRLEIDFEPNEAEVLRLARSHNLSVYDTVYLELAHRRSFQLATLDSALARAARVEKVPLIK